MHRALWAIVLLGLGLGAWLVLRPGAEPASPARAQRERPEVWTTFYPTTWMAERIGGDLVRVMCPLPSDEDPVFWEPTSEMLQGYQAADLVLVNGAEFEKWVATASLPAARLVDTTKVFTERFVRFEGGGAHSHGGGAAHTHTGIDGHTWLDPQNAALQAEAIHKALVRLLPAQRAVLDERAAALARDLAGLDAQLKALGSLPTGRHLYASHPAYNYLAQRYGWPVVNLDLDPESMPSDEVLAEIKASLAQKPSTHLVWESAPLPAIRERFQQELSLISVVVSPCETTSPEDRAAGRDYLVRWNENIEALRPAFAAR